MGALWPGGRGLLPKVTLNGEWELLPFANPLPAPVEPEDGVADLLKTLNFPLLKNKALELQRQL